MSDQDARERRRREEEERQTAALAGFGFGPAFPGGGDVFTSWFATCETCGAAVRIVMDPAAAQPVVKHHLWHTNQEDPAR